MEGAANAKNAGLPAEPITFSIGEVAEMVGVSAHVIRAWERRYNAVRPVRTPSNQRRYTPEDVESLIRMKDAARVDGLSLRLAAVEQETGHLAGVLSLSMAASVDETSAYEPDAWRAVADLLPQLILVIDSRGRIVDANMAVARAADMVRSRLQGVSFVDMVDPYDREKAVTVYRSPALERRGWDLNLRMRRLARLHSFDCWSVTSRGQRLTILVGRDVSAPPPDLGSRPSVLPDQ